MDAERIEELRREWRQFSHMVPKSQAEAIIEALQARVRELEGMFAAMQVTDDDQAWAAAQAPLIEREMSRTGALVAEAVAAERERCARIVEQAAMYAGAKRIIAKRIRAGEQEG